MSPASFLVFAAAAVHHPLGFWGTCTEASSLDFMHPNNGCIKQLLAAIPDPAVQMPWHPARSLGKRF
jgi:hypothetical protein